MIARHGYRDKQKYRNNVTKTSVSGRKQKQISKKKLMKQMLPGMKLIILANMNVKLFSWTFTFCKVVRQQI